MPLNSRRSEDILMRKRMDTTRKTLLNHEVHVGKYCKEKRIEIFLVFFAPSSPLRLRVFAGNLWIQRTALRAIPTGGVVGAHAPPATRPPPLGPRHSSSPFSPPCCSHFYPPHCGPSRFPNCLRSPLRPRPSPMGTDPRNRSGCLRRWTSSLGKRGRRSF